MHTLTHEQPAASPRGGSPLCVVRVMDKLGYEGGIFGPGRMWLNTLGRFDTARFRVVPAVLRLDLTIGRQFAERGITLLDLRCPKFDPRTVLKLAALFRRERANLVHLHGLEATCLGRIAARLVGLPAIMHQHDRAKDPPWYVRRLDGWLAGSTALAIGVSPETARACTARRHMPQERVVVLPNAIDPDWVRPSDPDALRQLRRRLQLPEHEQVVGTVTRLRVEKDIPLLLRAVEALRSYALRPHLLIVGEGPQRQELEELAGQLGIADRIRWAGFQADVRPYLELMDVAVFTERTEGCPNAMLEAAAMGRPIVAVPGSGIQQVLRHEANGLVSSLRAPAAMAAMMRRVLADPQEARRLGEAARQTIASDFNADRYVESLQGLYDRVAGEAA